MFELATGVVINIILGGRQRVHWWSLFVLQNFFPFLNEQNWNISFIGNQHSLSCCQSAVAVLNKDWQQPLKKSIRLEFVSNKS